VNLSEISKAPALTKIIVDDAETVEEYGESIEFYTWDRQPMHMFMKLGTINQDNTEELLDVVSNLVLDEEGNKIFEDDKTIPMNLMIKIINIIVEDLGK